ncbi:Rapamycin-insensitive companion of mTOR, N-term-domain-containing protein [Ephemerocybe angulata]|uniref:Rapamycin-insensitive companion of mTOR, N-term-domain-containing protein n=1 Tax=Ephemerocybe angulata TaxID=980116 RepID=A0A8H6I1X3_9AGAR|nr:Rapamycin-insensitive companion of mTOR, N-term-domain-containing protein [Tulosesus angulatus]
MPAALSSSNLTASSNATLVNNDGFTQLDTGISLAELEGREPSEQLALLNEHLTRQNRIKDGAENLLIMPLATSVRQQVESELDMANNKIEALQKRIDLQSTRSKQQAMVDAQRKLLEAQNAQKPTSEGVDKSGDDFRTALQNATNYLRELDVMAHPHPESSLNDASTSNGDTQTSSATDSDRRRVELLAKLINIMLRHLRVRYELRLSDLLRAVVPCLSDRSSKQCRASAYRLIRQVLVDPETVEQLDRTLDWYLIKSLQRDNKHAMEKEQAVKLIRTIIEVGTSKKSGSIASGADSATVHLSEAVMRAVIAVAEHPEDPFRPICIQTLTEILLMDIDLLARSGGIRVLLHVLGEGPHELAPIIASAFLHIVDSPRTRAYLSVGTDIEMALSAITDAYGKPVDQRDKIKACSKVVQLILRTWSGLMYFCLEDMRAIRSLVNTLRIPSLETRELILDMFFDLLNIKAPEWYQTFIDGRRLTMYRRRSTHPDQQKEPEAPERPHQTLKLTDQYLALLLVILTNAGSETTMGTTLSRKATLLMAEILAMSNRVLPLTTAGRIQAIPPVFDMATDYENKEHRIVGTSAVSAIDSFNRNKARLETHTLRQEPNSVEDAVRRGQRQVEQVKLKISMQMDDKTFQAAIVETQVMSTKDPTKWDYEAVAGIHRGPVAKAIKASRFIRRLIHQFSDMKRTKASSRWVKLGCTLMSTLMATPEGVKYLLVEDQFLSQIRRSFAQLDPFGGVAESEPIFSKKRVADTLTYGYLEMLGTLSKYKDGLLEKFHIFTSFYRLSELRSREDLMKGIVENLDYSVDGHARIHIRLYATKHLGTLIRNLSTANAWTLGLLLTQLYDPAPEVCELAVHFWKKLASRRRFSSWWWRCNRQVDHLGEIGHPLLLKFMSTPMGFRYLYDAGYIDREMDIWFNEVFLAKVFSAGNHGDYDDDLLAFDGSVPPHFYGEIFAQFIRQHSHDSEDPDLTMKLKSILWAVGNVGATEGGLHFLEEEEVIPAVLDILDKSPIPSVKGTCFFILGLISSTSQGAEILDDYHWESTLTPLGFPTGICIPVDIEKFLSIPHWTAKEPASAEPRLLPATAEHEIEIMTAIQNLSNTVIANAASRSLTRRDLNAKAQFHSPEVFYRALHVISSHRYRLPVRRYIVDLFSSMELDEELVAAFNEAAKKLPKASSTSQLPKADRLRLSILPGIGRSRHSESDESDEEGGMDTPPARKVVTDGDNPILSLLPQRKLVGFEALVRYAAAALASNPEKTALARGEYLRTHFKNMREVAAALSGMKLQKAYAYLADVGDHNRVIPFRRFAGGVGRTGQAKEFKATQGRWPEKSIKFITRLLKNAESNADAKNLDVEELTIRNIGVQQAPKTRRRTYRAHGRINPYQGHPCHVEIILSAPADEVEKSTAPSSALAGLNRRQVARKRIEAARA